VKHQAKAVALGVIAALILSPLAVVAQDLMLADNYRMYAVHWNGSLVSGTTVSIAVPETLNATKQTYPIGVQLISTAPVAVTITIISATHPTTTEVTPTPLNTTVPAEFKGYVNSNAGFGGVITQEPPSNYHSIMLDGTKFPSGKSNARNINFHIAAAAATGYVTWKVGQK